MRPSRSRIQPPPSIHCSRLRSASSEPTRLSLSSKEPKPTSVVLS
ncbi:hypothetical protein CCUS01_17012, partial [Colletotrichum cuscutae]